MRRLICVFAVIAVSPAVFAQIDPEIVQAFAGTWFLADASGKGCNLTLLVDDVIGGHVGVEADCAVSTVPGADIAAWTLADSRMILLDATRRVLFRLSEQEYGAWTAEGDIALTPSEAGVVALPITRDLFGTWTMKRPDGPSLCSVTLKDEEPLSGREGIFALDVADGCDPAVSGFQLASWEIEGVTVVLYGAGGRSLAFLADGDGGYRSKTAKEGGKPLLMVYNVEILIERLSSQHLSDLIDAADQLLARKAVIAIPKLAAIDIVKNPDAAPTVILTLGTLAGMADPTNRKLATDHLIALLQQKKAIPEADAPYSVLYIYEALGDTADPSAAAVLESELLALVAVEENGARSDTSLPLAALSAVVEALVKLKQPSSLRHFTEARTRVAALSFDDSYTVNIQKEILASLAAAIAAF